MKRNQNIRCLMKRNQTKLLLIALNRALGENVKLNGDIPVICKIKKNELIGLQLIMKIKNVESVEFHFYIDCLSLIKITKFGRSNYNFKDYVHIPRKYLNEQNLTTKSLSGLVSYFNKLMSKDGFMYSNNIMVIYGASNDDKID